MQGETASFDEPQKTRKKRNATVLVAERRAKKRAAKALADLSRFDSGSSDDEAPNPGPDPVSGSPPPSGQELDQGPGDVAAVEIASKKGSTKDTPDAAGKVVKPEPRSQREAPPFPSPQTRSPPLADTEAEVKLEGAIEAELATVAPDEEEGGEEDSQSLDRSTSGASDAEQGGESGESGASDAEAGGDSGQKSSEGGSSFATAFAKVMGRRIVDDASGPILAGRKKLLASKLQAQEEADLASAERRKERTLVREKNHVKPQLHADVKERALIKLATKGVVRLFNAVQKAQEARQEALGSSRRAAKGASEAGRAAFIKELKGVAAGGARPSPTQRPSKQTAHTVGPGGTTGWSVLRDDFVLERPTLRGFDRRQDDPEDGIIRHDESDDE